jgi:HPt (histidine-containing phosphotransfer) domain-containing protein
LSGSELTIFDTQFAKNQFSGNQLLLLQILNKFLKQYVNFDTLLTERLQQDLQAAKQEVHTVKGVSGNLGMTALHNACKELETSLDSPTSEYTLESFLLVFKQTITVVQNYSTENAVEESANVAPQQDEKSILISALKRNEFISESKMQSYLQSLDLPSEKLNELKQAIDELEYETAIKLLE